MRKALSKLRGLLIHQMPRLKSPQLVVGFAGWPNAAEAATGSINYLRKQLQATKFAEIQSEEFYELTITRPLTVLEQGLIKQVDFPANEFFFSKRRKAPHDLILFQGTEPNLRWHDYVAALLGVAQHVGVTRIYALGGYFDSVPHTQAPRLTAAVSDPALKEVLLPYDVDFVDYEGPTSIQTALMVAGAQQNIEVIGIWGRAPYYVQVPNPKVCHAVLTTLTSLLGLEVDLEGLRQAGQELDRRIAEALEENPQLKGYVEQMEKAYEAAAQETPLDKDQIIRGIEDFFRKSQDR